MGLFAPLLFLLSVGAFLPPSAATNVCGTGAAHGFPTQCFFNSDVQHRYVCCDKQGCDGFNSVNLTPHCKNFGFVPPNFGVVDTPCADRCNVLSALPNRCCNAEGTLGICCPGQCGTSVSRSDGKPGTIATCATTPSPTSPPPVKTPSPTNPPPTSTPSPTNPPPTKTPSPTDPSPTSTPSPTSPPPTCNCPGAVGTIPPETYCGLIDFNRTVGSFECPYKKDGFQLDACFVNPQPPLYQMGDLYCCIDQPPYDQLCGDGQSTCCLDHERGGVYCVPTLQQILDACKNPTPAPTTKAPTPAPTTATPAPTTKAPTPAPTTATPAPTTATPAPTTKAPTPAPTTATPAPTTAAPTPAPTTATPAPTTAAPTPAPTTATPAPTTAAPTPAPTTATPAPTTKAPTPAPTTSAPTPAPTTAAPTPAPTTAAPTPAPTTAAPTPAPTTATPAPTTKAPTGPPTTVAPTPAPTTAAPTPAPTTAAPTSAPTTAAPAPTTKAPTPAPTTPSPPPGFCAVGSTTVGVCNQDCGNGGSGCNCFDLEVVLKQCVPCASGTTGTAINTACVVNGAPQGSNMFSSGTTFCLANASGNPTTSPCDINPTCNNSGGSANSCGPGGLKCCHF